MSQPAEKSQPVKIVRARNSITMRIGVGIAVITLAFALLMGILSIRITQHSGIATEVANQLQELLFWGGLSGVIMSTLLGILIARRIGEPMRKLTGDIATEHPQGVDWSAPIYHDYDEIEQLTLVMQAHALAQKTATLELANSERKFRETFNLVEVGMVHVDREGRFRLLNHKFSEILGYSADELIGKVYFSITHPDDREHEIALLKEVVAGRISEVPRVEKRIIHKSGNIVWVRRSVVVICDDQGQFQYALAVIEDITADRDAQNKLQTLNESLRAVVENSPLAIYAVTVEGVVTLWNPAAEKLFGVSSEAAIGKLSPHYTAGREATILQLRAKILAGETIHDLEVQELRPDGTTVFFSLSAALLRGNDQGPLGILIMCADITEAKRIASALAYTQGRFQALTESAMDIFTVLDADGIIRYQSPSVIHLLGYTPDEMIGMSQFDLIHRDDVELMQIRFAELLVKGVMDKPIEFRVKNKQGAWRSLESIGKNCLNIPAINGVIVNTRDVTERREIQQRMQHLAYHDALTGLPNRSLMQDKISQAISRARRHKNQLAVMFIDIDNFKNINDTLGHDVGDVLLQEVAQRLKKSIRSNDAIGRQGGDEFIVLLDQIDSPQGVTRVAQKILDSLRAAFMLGASEQHISGSIGVSVFPDDGPDSQTLLKNADTAMFYGKSQGKNSYHFFTQKMTIAVKRRAKMESSLRAAVKESNFSLVYQPQLDLQTGVILGVEALIRWNASTGETIMPSEFIPVAEDTGLIYQMGAWVLRESCRQHKLWRNAGLPPMRMAVNVSARQLDDKGFTELLSEIIQDSGISPQHLELELTETQVMRQGDGSVERLKAIADMGVNLAIDDFGTGYCSLSYLKRLPIGKLKIDQSFVRDISEDANDLAVVIAIISMAKSLGLDVIAEGIETQAQLLLLRDQGCTVGQGYYFSKPLTATELTPLLKTTLLDKVSALPRR